jgi:hypothetical protein
METGCIVNENILRSIIKKYVEEESKRVFPKDEVENLWVYLNRLHEQMNVIQEQIKRIEIQLKLK